MPLSKKIVIYSRLTDIIIPYGGKCNWQHNELKFALRAIDKHLMGYGEVYIIGNPVSFLTNVKYLPFTELYTQKQKSIFNKILSAAKHPDISDPFAMWNDDHYLLQPLNVKDLKYYYSGTVELLGKLAGGTYQRICINSAKYLAAKGYGGKNFDIHVPILYGKKEFAELENEDWNQEHIIKSLYCNRLHIEGEQMRDLKFSIPKRYEEIKAAIKDRLFFSLSEHGANEAMKRVLNELYPEKSKFEK